MLVDTLALMRLYTWHCQVLSLFLFLNILCQLKYKISYRPSTTPNRGIIPRRRRQLMLVVRRRGYLDRSGRRAQLLRRGRSPQVRVVLLTVVVIIIAALESSLIASSSSSSTPQQGLPQLLPLLPPPPEPSEERDPRQGYHRQRSAHANARQCSPAEPAAIGLVGVVVGSSAAVRGTGVEWLDGRARGVGRVRWGGRRGCARGGRGGGIGPDGLGFPPRGGEHGKRRAGERLPDVGGVFEGEVAGGVKGKVDEQVGRPVERGCWLSVA